MSVHAAISQYLARRVALWERRRTEKFINNLPHEIRKDIGWPDPVRRRQRESLWERRW